MKVNQLIKRLNELVETNPENGEVDIAWYDEFTGHLSHGDGRPIQLYYYPLMKRTICLLNAVHGAPGCYVAISDKGKIKDELKMV